MPTPSNWTLTPGAIRFFVPLFLQRQLSTHPLTESLYLNGCGYYPTAHGHQMQREEHEDHLLLYCTAGSGTLHTHSPTEQLLHNIHAGDIMLLPKGIPHHYQADGKKPWTLYWVHFDGILSQRYCQHITDDPTCNVIHLGISPDLINHFEQLFNARNTGYNLPVFINTCHHLGQLLTSVAISSIHRQGSQTTENIFAPIIVHMESVIDTTLDLNSLALLAGLSKYHFIKKYKETFGYAPIQHFIHRKMERACLLLDTTPLSIGDVALKLGYEDPHYFSRLFKKVTGLSPLNYRNLQRG